MRNASARAQQGQTLIELLAAIAIGAIILAALNSVVKLGLDAQSAGRSTNELAYQGRFALERMAANARTVAPKLIAVPASGAVTDTTFDWFAPAKYCRNGTNQLIETTTADTNCTGTTVIANNVTAFAATLPAAAGPLNDPTATLSLTLADPAGKNTLTLSTNIRLGGGVL